MLWTATQWISGSFTVGVARCRATDRTRVPVGQVQCPAQVAAAGLGARGTQTAAVEAMQSQVTVTVLETLCPLGPRQRPPREVCRCQVWPPCRRPGAVSPLCADPLHPQAAERNPSIRHPFTTVSWIRTRIRATILSGEFSFTKRTSKLSNVRTHNHVSFFFPIHNFVCVLLQPYLFRNDWRGTHDQVWAQFLVSLEACWFIAVWHCKHLPKQAVWLLTMSLAVSSSTWINRVLLYFVHFVCRPSVVHTHPFIFFLL